MSQDAAAVLPPSRWIISPLADLVFLVGTPLAIVPVLLLVSAAGVAHESLALAVFAFGSLGHHLPGWLRAYGDRDLFARYKLRLLLAPPLVLLLNWFCFQHQKLHGLELLLLFWSTWHILMQTYGFLRLYDVRRQRGRARDAWLDWFAVLAVFGAGIVFSDVRVFGIVEVLWLTGWPQFGPEWLTAARWLAGGGVVAVFLAYVLRLRTEPPCAPKLLLLATTTFLFWFAGQRWVDLLLGVAMFETFHAVQYFAIVWSVSRRRQAQSGLRGRLLRRMFSGHLSGVLLYVAAIAAFGSLGFWGRGSEAAAPWAVTLFSTSAMLHFYYDGFLWKLRPADHVAISLREMSLPRTTVDETRLITRSVMATWRAGRVLCGPLVLVGLLACEQLQRERLAESGTARNHALHALTPLLPEALLRLSGTALAEGDLPRAQAAADQAARLRPASFAAHMAAGAASSARLDWSSAQRSYGAATRLRPAHAVAHYEFGRACVQEGQFDAAQRSLEACLRLQPDHLQATFQLGNVFFQTESPREAIACYRRCTELHHDFPDAFDNLGAAYFALEDWPAALAVYREAARLRPNHAATHFHLGLVFLAQGDLPSARASLLAAEERGYAVPTEVQAAAK